MRRALVVLVLATFFGVAAVAALAAPNATACTAGVHPYGGANARTFCGPARATVVIGGRTIHYSGGNCERGAAYVSLNIGTVVLGTSTKPKTEYFGLLVGKAPIVGGSPATHDGTFVPEALVADHAGKGYAMTQAKVKLAGNRTRGTFTAHVFGGGSARGSFHC
jgi:hypothetical protein